LPQFPPEEFFARLMEECFLIHPTILVRTACYRAIGAFDERLIRGQDYAMTLRLARQFPSAMVTGPTIYRRFHAGMRGSAVAQIASDAVAAGWLKYDQITLSELRRDLSLEEYLPQSSRTVPLAPLVERRAYLQRAVIMGKKALFGEMLEDLATALRCAPEAEPLSRPEQEMLQRLGPDIASGEAERALLSRLRSLGAGELGRAIRIELARGLVWRARREAGQGRYRQALKNGAAAWALCGLGGIKKIITRR